MKGGLGAAGIDEGAIAVRALAAVNALGDVRDGEGRIVAGARNQRGEWLDSAAWLARGGAEAPSFDELAGKSTTLCVVATNVALDQAQLGALARAASAALYRRITPVATPYDGDVVFATAPLENEAGIAVNTVQLEALAVRALEQAIERAVRTRVPGDILSR